MLFANDIVLKDETKEVVNAKLNIWRNTLESQGFKLSRKLNIWNASLVKIQVLMIVKLEAQIIPRKYQIKYLGLINQKYEEINVDVTHRIKA